MRIFIPGFLLFLMYALLGRWYFVCEVRHHCGERETTETVKTATLVLTEGDKVVLEGFEQFFFPPDSIRPILSEENNRFLDELASFLAQNPSKQLLITGFYLQSESLAPSGFFENPGQARAAQIGLQLEDRGIDPLRITLHNMALERDTLLEPVRFLIRKSTGPLLINDPKND